jgi:hypothetical protein
MLEVGAATGLMTAPLLSKAKSLTALEPSPGMLRRLVSSDVASDPRLGTMQGMAEDLGADAMFDVAVVTFTPRRGIGLAPPTLAVHVRDRVVMLLETTGRWTGPIWPGGLAWGWVRVHLVAGESGPRASAGGDSSRRWPAAQEIDADDIWEFEQDARRAASGARAATRLVRYFLTSGARAVVR